MLFTIFKSAHNSSQIHSTLCLRLNILLDKKSPFLEDLHSFWELLHATSYPYARVGFISIIIRKKGLQEVNRSSAGWLAVTV